MNDPLLSQVSLKPLEEIVAAAKETIHRHRRRFLQRNGRPCPPNCGQAEAIGHRIVGCRGCGSRNPEQCLNENKFAPMFSKSELARQFADQLRDPEALLREYRDVTVFLWVLGAFDKQARTVDERIVSGVEKNDKARRMAVGQGELAAAPAGAGAAADSGARADEHGSGKSD